MKSRRYNRNCQGNTGFFLPGVPVIVAISESLNTLLWIRKWKPLRRGISYRTINLFVSILGTKSEQQSWQQVQTGPAGMRGKRGSFTAKSSFCSLQFWQKWCGRWAMGRMVWFLLSWEDLGEAMWESEEVLYCVLLWVQLHHTISCPYEITALWKIVVNSVFFRLTS